MSEQIQDQKECRETLLPCPFCGCKVEYRRYHQVQHPENNCLLSDKTFRVQENYEETTPLWNTRTHSDKADVVEYRPRYTGRLDTEDAVVPNKPGLHQVVLGATLPPQPDESAMNVLPQKLRNMIGAHLDGIYLFSAREDCDTLLSEIFAATLGLPTEGGA